MIRRDSTLREVAFEICTALDHIGVRAVLTGGSAATVYAPRAYQSRDLDFIVQFHAQAAKPGDALKALGYTLHGQTYEHACNPLTLDFPKGPLMVGGDYLPKWSTMRKGRKILHILTPTDCCRDRLAAFLFWKDFSGLEQALAVARTHRTKVNLKAIRDWCLREGEPERFAEFERRLRKSSS